MGVNSSSSDNCTFDTNMQLSFSIKEWKNESLKVVLTISKKISCHKPSTSWYHLVLCYSVGPTSTTSMKGFLGIHSFNE